MKTEEIRQDQTERIVEFLKSRNLDLALEVEDYFDSPPNRRVVVDSWNTTGYQREVSFCRNDDSLRVEFRNHTTTIQMAPNIALRVAKALTEAAALAEGT